MTATLRTPDSRFASVPDFPYTPHYLSHKGLRIAYIDENRGFPRSSETENDAETETFLCLHGQPTWSYLYRKMIPVFLEYTTKDPQQLKRRVVAPDLLGFGRSDKPTRDADYTFNMHREMLLDFIHTLDLRNMTLVVQDWGGLLGLTLPMEEAWRFRRLIVMNTTLAVGQSPTDGFIAWREYCNRTPDMAVGALIGRGTKHLSEGELGAYDAPFPSREYKAGVRRFPNLVMTDGGQEGVDVSRRAGEFYRNSGHFGREDVFMACGLKDPVLGPPVMKALSKVFGKGCLWMDVEEAGHFVQEWGESVARSAVEAFENGGRAEGVRRIGAGAGAKL